MFAHSKLRAEGNVPGGMGNLAHAEPAFLDEWLDESARRFEAYERGKETAVDFDEAIQEIHRQIHR